MTIANPYTLAGFLWLCAATAWMTAAIVLLPLVLVDERPRLRIPELKG